MNVTNKKITIELSIRELELIDLSISFTLADYWNKYTKTKNEDDKKHLFRTFSDLDKLSSEINKIRQN